MFRTLFLTFLTVVACGCQSYQVELDLPARIERIKVEPITGSTTAYGQLITDHLKHELAKEFIITEENPDLVISGSATKTTLSTAGETLFVLRTKLRKVGTISTTQNLFAPDAPKSFAKKIKNILTKNR